MIAHPRVYLDQLDPARQPGPTADVALALQGRQGGAHTVGGADAELLHDLAQGRGRPALGNGACDEVQDGLVHERTSDDADGCGRPAAHGPPDFGQRFSLPRAR